MNTGFETTTKCCRLFMVDISPPMVFHRQLFSSFPFQAASVRDVVKLALLLLGLVFAGADSENLCADSLDCIADAIRSGEYDRISFEVYNSPNNESDIDLTVLDTLHYDRLAEWLTQEHHELIGQLPDDSIETSSVFFLRYRAIGRFVRRLSSFTRPSEPDLIYLQHEGNNYVMRLSKNQPSIDNLLRKFHAAMYSPLASDTTPRDFDVAGYLEKSKAIINPTSLEKCSSFAQKGICCKYVSPETRGEIWGIEIGGVSFVLADRLRAGAREDNWDAPLVMEIGAIILKDGANRRYRFSWFLDTKYEWTCDSVVICGRKFKNENARQVHVDMLGYILDYRNLDQWPDPNDLEIWRLGPDGVPLFDLEIQWKGGIGVPDRSLFFEKPKRKQLPNKRD